MRTREDLLMIPSAKKPFPLAGEGWEAGRTGAAWSAAAGLNQPIRGASGEGLTPLPGPPPQGGREAVAHTTFVIAREGERP